MRELRLTVLANEIEVRWGLVLVLTVSRRDLVLSNIGTLFRAQALSSAQQETPAAINGWGHAAGR
jgi:hypothetical protein